MLRQLISGIGQLKAGAAYYKAVGDLLGQHFGADVALAITSDNNVSKAIASYFSEGHSAEKAASDIIEWLERGQRTPEQLSAQKALTEEFKKYDFNFMNMDPFLHKALIDEAVLFGRVERTVEMFFELADQIEQKSVSRDEKAQMLVEAYRTKASLYGPLAKDLSVSSVEHEDIHGKPASDSIVDTVAASMDKAASVAAEYVALQKRYLSIARTRASSAQNNGQRFSPDMEEKIVHAFSFGASVHTGHLFELPDDRIDDGVRNFISKAFSTTDADEIESLTEMIYMAVEAVDEKYPEIGMDGVREYLNDKESSDKFVLAKALGYR
jgi:hypothetical protein